MNQKTTTTELCGCEADEQGIEHTIAAHFPEGVKFMTNKTTIEKVKQLFAQLLCKIFGHKFTGNDDAYDEPDNYPCERDCGYISYNS